LLALALLVGCAAETSGSDQEQLATAEEAATVCGVGPTLEGIDVSKYQGTINWSSVAADDVKFAFVRVSDGTTVLDAQFAANWSGAHAAGLARGAYQFFRPGQDPIAQADILLDAIGRTIGPDDLPPVIDVEASDGKSAAQIEDGVRAWIDHVRGVLGRDPIIYTGFYFWRDTVGAPDITTSPLWHAQYTTASCPNIAPPWEAWSFWQHTDSGTVDGISGGVDMNRFNGDEAAFAQLLGPAGSCGDGTCGANESSLSCVEDCGPCGTVGYAGAVIDDGDACFEAGGPPTSMRHVTDAGKDGDLQWTYTTTDSTESNYGAWHLVLEERGRYTVEVFTDPSYAHSRQAKYVVQAGGRSTDVVIDQTATLGWQSLGTFDFEVGDGQSVRVGDNTGEPLADKVQLAFDAVRLTRVDTDGDGDGSDMDGPHAGDETGGCNAGGSSSGLALVALLGFVGRRRRRRG
jgi:uncharacterized protein (TIGR03382 family)